MDCSIVITDQCYENNNCYHVTIASEGKDLMIVDSHVLEASATQMTHVRLI